MELQSRGIFALVTVIDAAKFLSKMAVLALLPTTVCKCACFSIALSTESTIQLKGFCQSDAYTEEESTTLTCVFLLSDRKCHCRCSGVSCVSFTASCSFLHPAWFSVDFPEIFEVGFIFLSLDHWSC